MVFQVIRGYGSPRVHQIITFLFTPPHSYPHKQWFYTVILKEGSEQTELPPITLTLSREFSFTCIIATSI